MARKFNLVPLESIERRILLFRGRKAILDADLAEMFGVSTKRLNEQVKRNIARFPEDFVFQLAAAEKAEVVANCDHLQNLKFSPALPYAFTEHGAIMAANVLNSRRAIAASVYIVRAFVRLREMLSTHKELAHKLEELERRIDTHDKAIRSLVSAIHELMTPPVDAPKERIGFKLSPRKSEGDKKDRK